MIRIDSTVDERFKTIHDELNKFKENLYNNY